MGLHSYGSFRRAAPPPSGEALRQRARSHSARVPPEGPLRRLTGARPQPWGSSRMSLAQNTMTTTEIRKMTVAAALTSGVIPRRRSPQI